MTPRVVHAGAELVWELTGVLARSMEDDPLVRWPLPESADAEVIRSSWVGLIEAFADIGALWATEGGHGAAVWLAPEAAERFPEFERGSRDVIRRFTDDDGLRYAKLWDWVDARLPQAPCWFLEIIGVDTPHQGAGLGKALITHGLALARQERMPAFLETGNPRNVQYYERFGFRVVEDADAPRGGPHVWFMRCDAPLR